MSSLSAAWPHRPLKRGHLILEIVMDSNSIKSIQPTCKGCDGPLKPADHDGVCSTTCAHLAGEKHMSDEHFDRMFSFVRSGGFDESF